jgi:molecular chaperone HtpG
MYNAVPTTIDQDYKLDDLILFKRLKSTGSPFLPKIQEVYELTKDILNNRVQYVFPNFTLHNVGHSFRIMEYMAKLVADIDSLNELEVALLIYSALLHDIGMAVSKEDIELIETDSFTFCETKFSVMLKITNADKSLALQEYVRRIHSSLSAKYVAENLTTHLTIPKLPSLDFAKELALICESHTKDYDWIKTNLKNSEVKGDYFFNSQYIACILRLADILDFDANRTPYSLYKMISPDGISKDEWLKHFVISNNEKIIKNETTGQKKIIFYGKCENASIHRKILVYIGWIKDELTNAVSLVKNLKSEYSLFFDPNPEVHIDTQGYTFSDYRMTLEYKAISSFLMGEKIYGSKSLGLRELIQNSIDSCRLRQETADEIRQFGEDAYTPKIKVILDSQKRQVTIKDNGTGMSMDIVKKHFLNIGVSYYNSTDFFLKDFQYKPIGNFGIGFLSCFMLSDSVSVMTRYYKEKNRYTIELEKGNEWTSLTVIEDVQFQGTEVILSYDNFMHVFENKTENVRDFVRQYFLTDGIDFELVDVSSKVIHQVKNPIILESPPEKGFFKVDLSNYLQEIDGYALIRGRKAFVKSLDDLSFNGEIFHYTDSGGFQELREGEVLNIDDFVNDQELRYIEIPIIESEMEEEFERGMKFTNDDLEEVITKLAHKLRWISILVPKEDQADLESETLSKGSTIFDDLTFTDLVNIGHMRSCDSRSYIKTINLFEGRKNELYLPFENNSEYNDYYSRKTRKELFIRGVLIKDFRFNLSTIASIFEIQTLVVNINSRKVVPDISRNNLDYDGRKLISYIVGKAIHDGAKTVLDLSDDERDTLTKFTETFYFKATDFEKGLK